jgi:hypothetical protein
LAKSIDPQQRTDIANALDARRWDQETTRVASPAAMRGAAEPPELQDPASISVPDGQDTAPAQTAQLQPGGAVTNGDGDVVPDPNPVAKPTAPPPPKPKPQPRRPQAFVIILPKSGKTIDDPSSSTGYLMGTKSDLTEVAAGGQKVADTLNVMAQADPSAGLSMLPYIVSELRKNVYHYGTFDYQRLKDDESGRWVHIREFENVANFSVGLFCQKAGLSLGQTMWVTGQAFRFGSSNAADRKTGLLGSIIDGSQFIPEVRREFIIQGWNAGKSGEFDPPGK